MKFELQHCSCIWKILSLLCNFHFWLLANFKDSFEYLKKYKKPSCGPNCNRKIFIHLKILKKNHSFCAKNLDSKLFRCSYPQLLGLLITAQGVGCQAGRGTVLFFCCFQSHLLLLVSDALLFKRFWNFLPFLL